MELIDRCPLRLKLPLRYSRLGIIPLISTNFWKYNNDIETDSHGMLRAGRIL